MTPENPIYPLVDQNLKAWKHIPLASTSSLISADGHRLPKIHLASRRPGSPTIIFTSGLHLDEPHGPIALSDPQHLTSHFRRLTDRFNVDIYPLINQTARHVATSPFHPRLRQNHHGINYNDGWGVPVKSSEVAALQYDIWQTHLSSGIAFAASFHQDSTVGGGYAWLNGINPTLVNQIGDWSQRLIPKELLLHSPHHQAPPKTKHYHIIPDVDDLGTFETWAQYKLGVPVFCLEGPTPPASLEENIFFYQQWLTIMADLPDIR